MQKNHSFFLLFLWTYFSYASILVGVGGFDVIKNKHHYSFHDKNQTKHTFTNITEPLSKEAKNVNAISMWITRDWSEDWYDAKIVQSEIVDKGYTPVFIFYWFADEVSVAFIQKHQAEYFQTLRKFMYYLMKIDGKKIVVLNPEYNMAGVEQWQGMNQIFLKSFKILHTVPDVLVGPCVGDFGDYSSINEPNEWKIFHPSIEKAALEADFIAFQEMRALTRNSRDEILKVAQRSLYFSKYLYHTYHKPIMLAYLAISTYGDEGERLQSDVYKEFLKVLPRMKQEGKLFYFGIFHYFDYPGHQGYFNKAEPFFGILDSHGKEKPALHYFRELK
jgi:hypothetical protein